MCSLAVNRQVISLVVASWEMPPKPEALILPQRVAGREHDLFAMRAANDRSIRTTRRPSGVLPELLSTRKERSERPSRLQPSPLALNSVSAGSSFLSSLHQEIDLYDRKLAYLANYVEFASPADREMAKKKMLAKRAPLAETARKLAAEGIEFNLVEASAVIPSRGGRQHGPSDSPQLLIRMDPRHDCVRYSVLPCSI